MKHPLDSKFPTPIEREYEAWIIRGIEDYFYSLGESIFIAAVSPTIEVVWPADEAMIIGRKFIGLQFKTVKYLGKAPPASDFGRLMWSFHQPKPQFDRVLNFPEIYYCLPTFINREIRREALTHCLFWRPKPHKRSYDRNAWYNNPTALTRYNNIGNSSRWGKFLEDVVSCSIGRKVNSVGEAYGLLDEFRGFMFDQPEKFEDDDYSREQRDSFHSPFYLLAIPI